jgi:hypothetical protein
VVPKFSVISRGGSSMWRSRGGTRPSNAMKAAGAATSRLVGGAHSNLPFL